MHLLSVEMEDIKCFSNRPVDFTGGRDLPHNWVVVYGTNGMGKSTLLRAIALALTGQPAINALLPTTEGWVRSSKRTGRVTVRVTKGSGDVSVGFPRQRPIEIQWTLVGPRAARVGNKAQPAHALVLRESGRKPEKDDARLFKTQMASEEPHKGWLLCGYGPHRRLTGASSDISEAVSPDSRAGRVVTLFHEKAALTSAERWLIQLHHRSLANGDGDESQYRAVVEFINNGLFPDDVRLVSVRPGAVLFETPFSKEVPMHDLSDGYRTILALALDLLKHMSLAYRLDDCLRPGASGPPAIHAEGVVLIDEVDSHLHPNWQKVVGAWLHSRFPNVQFIVATHSPLIATRVSDEHGLMVNLKKARRGRGYFVVPRVREGTIGLTADQRLTGPSFGLGSTRDLLADEIERELLALRRKDSRRLSPDQRKRKEQLEFRWDRMASPAEDYRGIQDWQRRDDALQRAAARIEASQRASGAAPDSD